MIPLLAQVQLPGDWNGVTVLVVGTLAVLILVSGALLIGYQAARKAMSEEMRLQRLADEEAQKVEVQSPLTVQHQVKFATWEELEAVKREAHGRMTREKEEARLALEAFVKRFEADLSALGRTVTGYNTDANGRADRINERIDGLRDDIAQMPQQILQLIRNAQQI